MKKRARPPPKASGTALPIGGTGVTYTEHPSETDKKSPDKGRALAVEAV